MIKKTKQPSQTRSIVTRKNIIETAKKLFLKNGYKKTTTILISKEAKLSIGIIYSYFNDKKELFELWLNELLERCDEYFYNQFKLLDYEVELPLIVSNILDKLTSSFFSSPLLNESNAYLDKTLTSFFDKTKKIFIKSCNDNNIFIKNQNECSHIILHLIIDYAKDLKENIYSDSLKSRYIIAICALLKA